MGMLIRRHRKGVDVARQVDTTEDKGSVPTTVVVEGDTGVPATNEPTVPTGEVPARPVDAPTGDEAVAEGTTSADEIEDKTGEHDGQTTEDVSTPTGDTEEAQPPAEPFVDSEVVGDVTEASPEVSEDLAPKRNASRAAWAEFLNIGPDDKRTRDELAESHLGPVAE